MKTSFLAGLSAGAFCLSICAVDIRLHVEEPSGLSRRGWPVTSGVPFAEGALSDPRTVALFNSEGQRVSLQTQVLARWADRSVRWLLLDFQTDLAAGQKNKFTFRQETEPAGASISVPVRVTSRGSIMTIDTGPLQLELNRESFDPLGAVWLDRNKDGRFTSEERVTGAAGRGLFVRDARLRQYEAALAPAEIVLEEPGPLRACVRVTGKHAAQDGALFRYVLRIHAFAGQPFVRCFYTFINDAQDSVMTSIEELGLTTRLAPEEGPAKRQILDEGPVTGGRVFQVDEHHYMRDGKPDGVRARGWAAVGGEQAGFAVGLREFWQHWPKTGGYYTNAPLPVTLVYQMGHSANFGHVWISGDLDYYYLTGDRRAFDVALSVAEMMASSMTSKVGTHIRSLGWPTILVLAAYEATGEAKFLQAATKNWEMLKQSLDPQRGWVVRLASDHCLHPPGSTREERDQKYRDQRCEGNVPFMEGLTLCALARYHRHTGDPQVLRAITVGIDQMIRECWQEDVKTFRYTACPLSSKTPYALFMLCVEAMAYEARLTGNREHLRILREGFQAAVPRGDGNSFGKGFGQMAFFAPYALGALEK